MGETETNAWKMVTCSGCGRRYRCTPVSDYYNATTTEDGVCETCLLTGAGIRPDGIATVLGVVAVPSSEGGEE